MSQLTRPLEVIETEINFYKQQTATGIIEIGKRLIEAKAQLQHGEWGKWLEKFEFKERTAQRFMQVANEISKASALSDLPKTKVFALLDLPQEERETFIQQNNVEEMTTRQLQEAIKAKKEAEARVQNLSSQLQELKSIPPKVVEKVIEKEIVKQITPPDYEQAKYRYAELAQKMEATQKELDTLKKYRDHNEQQAKEYQELKKKIEFLKSQKSDLSRQIDATTELSRLTVRLHDVLKNELAPIKFCRTMEVLETEEIALNNLTEIVEMVESWCEEIRGYMPNKRIYKAEVIVNG